MSEARRVRATFVIEFTNDPLDLDVRTGEDSLEFLRRTVNLLAGEVGGKLTAERAAYIGTNAIVQMTGGSK